MLQRCTRGNVTSVLFIAYSTVKHQKLTQSAHIPGLQNNSFVVCLLALANYCENERLQRFSGY